MMKRKLQTLKTKTYNFGHRQPYMQKVLFLITSGDDKFELGFRMSYNSYKYKRFEDVKVIFFGPSQKRLIELTDEFKMMFEEMLKEKVIDSACIGVAERMNLKPQLERLGLNLVPVGERVAYYVNQGYEVITF